MTRTCNLALTLLAVVGLSSPAWGLTLTPGDLLGIDSVAPGGAVYTLVKYSQTGSILDTLALTGSISGTADGLTIIGSNVYMATTDGTVAQINLGTGALTPLFAAGGSGVEALGDLNGNIMVGNFGSNEIRIYTPAGAFVNTIVPSISASSTGLDSDGARIFVGSYGGDIHVLDLSGNVLNTIAANLGSGSISGLGYDASANTVWVSTGFSDDRIREYSLSGGAPLTDFAANWPFIDGLDVIPIPEPCALLLSGAALPFLACIRRRYAV